MKKAKTIAISAFSIIFIVLTIKDMGKLQNLTGKTFGTFQVLNLHGRGMSGHKPVTLWLCKCLKCGHEFISRTGSINFGDAGCRPCGGLAVTTHGMWTSKEYKSWQGMKSRCHNPKDDHYKNYGARGIIVCDRWINSFENFYADMGPRLKGMTIDRIKVNGNYEPSNCRWATAIEQANNRRDSKYLTFRGETLTQEQWCRKLGLSQGVIRYRLKCGLTVEEAFTKPVRVTKPQLA